MKSLGRLWGTGLVLASVLVPAKADIELTSVVYFNAEDSCQDAVGPPPLVSATVASSCEDLTTCELTDGAYLNTICVTTDGSTSGEFYSTFLSILFGAAPYLAVESYQDSSSCDDPDKLGSVVVFLANGKCNTDGATSFVATIAGTGDATLMFYADTECTPGQENGGLKQLSLDQDTSKSACLDDSNGAYSMAYGNGVTVIDSSGSTSSSGPTNSNSGGEGSTTGKYTVGAFFEDSECKQPTSVSIGTRDCSADFTASCMKVTEHYIQTSCAEDYLEYASAAFDGTPYLVEKHYDEESCTTEDHSMVYKADNACHTLSMTGAPSFTATLNTDGSGVLVKYSDAECKEDRKETALKKEQLTSHACIDQAKYYAFDTATTPAATTATPSATSTATSAATSVILVSSLLVGPLAFLGGLALLLL